LSHLQAPDALQRKAAKQGSPIRQGLTPASPPRIRRGFDRSKGISNF